MSLRRMVHFPNCCRVDTVAERLQDFPCFDNTTQPVWLFASKWALAFYQIEINRMKWGSKEKSPKRDWFDRFLYSLILYRFSAVALICRQLILTITLRHKFKKINSEIYLFCNLSFHFSICDSDQRIFGKAALFIPPATIFENITLQIWSKH